MVEPLARPRTQAEYEALGKKTLGEIHKQADSKRWRQCFSRPAGSLAAMKIYDMPYPKRSSPLRLYKGITTVRGISPAALHEEIWGLTDFRRIRQFDSVVDSYMVLEPVSEDIRVDYCTASLPWPVWNRTMVYALFRSPPPGSSRVSPWEDMELDLERKTFLWAVSIVHPKSPSPPKSIRVKLMGYFCFEALPGYGVTDSPGTRITRIIYGDPSGSMPAWLIRSQAQTQAQGIVDWIEKTYCKGKARL